MKEVNGLIKIERLIRKIKAKTESLVILLSSPHFQIAESSLDKLASVQEKKVFFCFFLL